VVERWVVVEVAWAIGWLGALLGCCRKASRGEEKLAPLQAR